MDGLKRSELRMVWSLSVDWFNPFHNKAAGRQASCGAIAMLLLNLPPSLHYRAENIYLHGVIPGPKEPSLNEVNHFLSPLMGQLETAYEYGVSYSKTHRHKAGRNTRSAVPVVVTDMPGARKITGMAGHSSKRFFCMLCSLSKTEINNFNWQEWSPRNMKVLRKAAEQWRDAPSQAIHDQIYEEFGIRWSELWRL